MRLCFQNTNPTQERIMQQWEYLNALVRIEEMDGGTTGEEIRDLFELFESEALTIYMDTLGEDGWELVTQIIFPKIGVAMAFKRLLQEE